MFREIIIPIFRSTRLCITVCGIMHPPRCCRLPPATSWVHFTTSCNTQSSVPEDGQNDCPKHIELTGIINKPLLLHLVGCLYYLYQWFTVKQIPDNEIYLLIKYIKGVLWRVAKHLSYTEDARRLKVNPVVFLVSGMNYATWIFHCTLMLDVVICDVVSTNVASPPKNTDKTNNGLAVC